MFARLGRYSLLVALFLCCLPVLHAQQGAPALRELADVGSVRLQGQRVAKLYLQAGQGVSAPAGLRSLGMAQGQADSELRRLERYARLPGSQRSYLRCTEVWQELRGVLGQPYSVIHAERAGQLADELAIHAGRLALQVESANDSPLGRQVDGAYRLNMLAQRLARLYMQVHGGDRTQGVLVDMEQTRREFSTGLTELEAVPGNSAAVREALVLARNQWIFFDAAVRQVTRRSDDPKPAQHVASSSERILEVLQTVATLYLQDASQAIKSR